jgi:hypothetical protein
MSYPERLAHELAAAGIGGARRRRIVAEIEDHLASDPGAQLGDAAALARQFADELGTRQARRAAFSAFAALALAGVLFLAALAALRSAGGFAVLNRQHESALTTLGAILAAVGAQVALVSGTLGCVRALRRRRVRVLSREEALVLVRRAGVGLAAGLVAMIGLAIVALAQKGDTPGWWTTFALVMAGAGALALAAAAPAVLAARRLTPVLEGAAGDLGDDLEGLVPPLLDPGSWSFALLIAGALAVLVAIAGAAQADPFDGLARGLADALVFIACYALLGGYLGLRRRVAG